MVRRDVLVDGFIKDLDLSFRYIRVRTSETSLTHWGFIDGVNEIRKHRPILQHRVNILEKDLGIFVGDHSGKTKVVDKTSTSKRGRRAVMGIEQAGQGYGCV